MATFEEIITRAQVANPELDLSKFIAKPKSGTCDLGRMLKWCGRYGLYELSQYYLNLKPDSCFLDYKMLDEAVEHKQVDFLRQHYEDDTFPMWVEDYEGGPDNFQRNWFKQLTIQSVLKLIGVTEEKEETQ